MPNFCRYLGSRVPLVVSFSLCFSAPRLSEFIRDENSYKKRKFYERQGDQEPAISHIFLIPRLNAPSKKTFDLETIDLIGRISPRCEHVHACFERERRIITIRNLVH